MGAKGGRFLVIAQEENGFVLTEKNDEKEMCNWDWRNTDGVVEGKNWMRGRFLLYNLQRHAQIEQYCTKVLYQ